MSQYIMRLDDASEWMDAMKWNRMEVLLDKYNIKPIVGVIPANQDPDMVGVYPKDELFWEKVQRWKEKGWTIALHGYTHVFETDCGGLNPVNHRSEFAGVPLECQKEKIRLGYSTLKKHGIKPEIFFAPAHTFDENTLVALREESDIRVISDTIANGIYYQNGFYFIPQQSGRVRKLHFKVCTFCYHPNIMDDNAFDTLEMFIVKENRNFKKVTELTFVQNDKDTLDKVLNFMYFFRRKV